MEKEIDEVVVTDKTKMDELLKLLEELVINKIRIEKIKQELKDNEYKKVLDQEIQLVSKVQEVVKKIQTTKIKVIYKKLQEEMKQKGIDPDIYSFSGEASEFDKNLEKPVFDILEIILGIFSDAGNNCILVDAADNSSGIIIEISSSNIKEIENREISKNSHISLSYADEDELLKWLLSKGISEFLTALKNIKVVSRTINASVDIECKDNKLSRIVLSVPNSSSITKAQFIKLSNQTFAIPVEYIDKIINFSTTKTERSNGKSFIKYMDHIIPIIPIDKKLDMVIEEEYLSYIVLVYNEQMKAMPVNSILEQSDIVVRPKPGAISEITEYKGTAILEDGNVTIVLDVPSLIQVNA